VLYHSRKVPMASDRQNRLAIVQFGRMLHETDLLPPPTGTFPFASMNIASWSLLLASARQDRASDMVTLTWTANASRQASSFKRTCDAPADLSSAPDVHGIATPPANGHRICRFRL